MCKSGSSMCRTEKLILVKKNQSTSAPGKQRISLEESSMSKVCTDKIGTAS